MIIEKNNSTVEQKALGYLRLMTGDGASDFHDGQLEAIVALLQNNRQMLVVQKTGWGKSAVYFIATKLLVGQSRGPSIIISPLIALMRNQIQSAARLGLKIVTINSSLSQQERAENETKIAARQMADRTKVISCFRRHLSC